MIPLSNIVELLVVYCVNILCVVLFVRTYDVILLFVVFTYTMLYNIYLIYLTSVELHTIRSF